ncbi:MAG: histidine kinase [Ruminiclostridium sp.]|nr:histidine kinase [Ruminiclostridium sp.]
MEEFISRIGIQNFVQMTIECWNAVFLLIMIAMMIIRRQPDKIGKAYNVKVALTDEILVFYTAVLLYDMFDIIWDVYYGDTSDTGFMICTVSAFFYFIVGAFQTLFFLQLVKTQVAVRNDMKWLKHITLAVQCLHIPCIILLIATPFTGALYYFDEFNHYNRGALYSVWYYATIVSFIYIIAVIFLTRKKIDRFFLRICATAGLISLIAFLINFVYRGMSINNISVSVTALIVFVMYEKFRSDMLVNGVKEKETVSRELAESKLELERSKNAILLAQIQPHFITNSLMALRARCKDNPEVYESLTNFSRYLRSNFEALGETSIIPFENEMQNIEAYLSLEKDNFGDRLNIVYDISFDRFLVPALSVQPLVENAVRHGVGTYDKGGTVRIRTFQSGGNVVIEVIDDGSGISSITAKQKTRKGIGIENVRSRLAGMDCGTLDIISTENGTTARITLTDTSLVRSSENADNT